MTVKEIILALQKATNQNAEVDIIDTEGNHIALPSEFVVIDEDDENVHIVLECAGL